MRTQDKQRGVDSDVDDLKQLENRHLLVGKSPRMIALTRVKATLLKSTREFFDNDGWVTVHERATHAI
jgi:aspartyl/asparaginyl-tRNA synthetase